MRILMISDVYFPRINGVSTSIQTFRETLAAEDVHVSLVAPNYEASPAGQHIGAVEAHTLRVAAHRIPFDPEDRLMRRGALARLDSHLAEREFDLVHIQTPFAAHYAGLKLARRRRTPCIATYHTHFEEYFHHYLPLLPRPLARGLTRRIARAQCNALDAVIVPSLAMQNALGDYGVTSPLHVLPTGIPLEQFSGGDGKAFRQRHGIAADVPMALYVGRVAHEKNLRFLLTAAAQAFRQRADWQLVIAGEGPALPALKRMAQASGYAQNIVFVGYLDRRNELPACYAAADLFVFPSLTETQGLVLLEAMACGLPVYGIPAMGAADIIGPGRGAVSACPDVQEFAQGLLRLLYDKARLSALSSEAREFAREWDAPARASELARLYRDILSRHTP